MRFDPDTFVADCRAALREGNPVRAVTEVVQRAIAAAGAIDDALGTEVTGVPDTLCASPDLTVQRIVWPGGSASAPHDHRMWAVVGVYAGRETNALYRRDGSSLAHHSTVVVDAGQVLALAADAVHAVANPDRRWTAGLHVYGGAIETVPRSAWRPDGTEVPLAEDASERRAMVQAMRDLAGDRGRALTDDERFTALTALWSEVARRRRNLSPSEARAVIAAAWAGAARLAD